MVTSINKYFWDTVGYYFGDDSDPNESPSKKTESPSQEENKREEFKYRSVLKTWEMPGGQIQCVCIYSYSYQFIFVPSNNPKGIIPLETTPSILPKGASAREISRRLSLIIGFGPLPSGSSRAPLQLILSRPIHISRLNSSIEIGEAEWCVTLIKSKEARHAQMLIEGIDKVHEQWAVTVDLISVRLTLGVVKMHDLTNQTIEYSSRGNSISVVPMKVRKLIESIQVDAAKSFDPEDPQSRFNPKIINNKIPFSTFGSRSIIGAPRRWVVGEKRHNCITYLLNKLDEAEIQEWRPRLVTLISDPNRYAPYISEGPSEPEYSTPDINVIQTERDSDRDTDWRLLSSSVLAFSISGGILLANQNAVATR